MVNTRDVMHAGCMVLQVPSGPTGYIQEVILRLQIERPVELPDGLLTKDPYI
jgi:hypothetical protein